jgi:hypothetical protein
VADRADQMMKEIEEYSQHKKTSCQQMSERLNMLASQIFGHSDIQSLIDLEKETSGAFATMNTFVDKLTSLIANIKNKDEEEIKAKQMRDETEAMVLCAREEAEKARESAKLAEEAKCAAEEASQFRKEEMNHETQTEMEIPPPRPPAPEILEEPCSVAPIFTTGLLDQVVQEGVKCSFHAKDTGEPLSRITWFKDGISVDKNTDYICYFESGICTLMIEESIKEDSANWSVRASNKAGYSESHAKLTVRENIPIEKEIQPNFIKCLPDQEVTEGESLELHCQVEGNPISNVSWFKNGVCIDKSKHYNIGGTDNDHILRIENVYLEDESKFSCRIQNKHGKAFSSSRITVKPLEPTEAPNFSVPLSNVLAITGQEILLECVVQGTPTPSLSWFKDNEAIKLSNDVEVSYNGSSAKLAIKDAFPQVGGKYVCKAQNIAGEATSTSTVYDKGSTAETSESDVAEKVETEKQKPAFYVPLANTECTEKEDSVLECIIVANPEPEVIWYKDNQPIKESNTIELLFQGDSCKLVLKDVERCQAGNYQVRAVNKFGECNSSCHLNVKSVKTVSETETQTTDSSLCEQKTHSYIHSVSSQSVTKTSFLSESGIEKRTRKTTEPKFLTPIQGNITEEGSKIVILSGLPEPRVTWLRNNERIQPDSDTTIIFDKKKTSLTITKVKCRDNIRSYFLSSGVRAPCWQTHMQS